MNNALSFFLMTRLCPNEDYRLYCTDATESYMVFCDFLKKYRLEDMKLKKLARENFFGNIFFVGMNVV